MTHKNARPGDRVRRKTDADSSWSASWTQAGLKGESSWKSGKFQGNPSLAAKSLDAKGFAFKAHLEPETSQPFAGLSAGKNGKAPEGEALRGENAAVGLVVWAPGSKTGKKKGDAKPTALSTFRVAGGGNFGLDTPTGAGKLLGSDGKGHGDCSQLPIDGWCRIEFGSHRGSDQATVGQATVQMAGITVPTRRRIVPAADAEAEAELEPKPVPEPEPEPGPEPAQVLVGNIVGLITGGQAAAAASTFGFGARASAQHQRSFGKTDGCPAGSCRVDWGDGSEVQIVPANQLVFLPRVPSGLEVAKVGSVVSAACPEFAQRSWARTRLAKVNGTELTGLKQAADLVAAAAASAPPSGQTLELEFEQITAAPKCRNGHPMTRADQSSPAHWSCDGHRLPGLELCLSGIRRQDQATGLVNWRCGQCDFHLCKVCAGTVDLLPPAIAPEAAQMVYCLTCGTKLDSGQDFCHAFPAIGDETGRPETGPRHTTQLKTCQETWSNAPRGRMERVTTRRGRQRGGFGMGGMRPAASGATNRRFCLEDLEKPAGTFAVAAGTQTRAEFPAAAPSAFAFANVQPHHAYGAYIKGKLTGGTPRMLVRCLEQVGGSSVQVGEVGEFVMDHPQGRANPWCPPPEPPNHHTGLGVLCELVC